jgi:hypothetical protein
VPGAQASHIRRNCIQADTRKVKDHVGETDRIRNQPGVIEIRDMYGSVEVIPCMKRFIQPALESDRILTYSMYLYVHTWIFKSDSSYITSASGIVSMDAPDVIHAGTFIP